MYLITCHTIFLTNFKYQTDTPVTILMLYLTKTFH